MELVKNWRSVKMITGTDGTPPRKACRRKRETVSCRKKNTSQYVQCGVKAILVAQQAVLGLTENKGLNVQETLNPTISTIPMNINMDNMHKLLGSSPKQICHQTTAADKTGFVHEKKQTHNGVRTGEPVQQRSHSGARTAAGRVACRVTSGLTRSLSFRRSSIYL